MLTASFVMVKGPTGADGKPTLRPYTPVSTNGKVYFSEFSWVMTNMFA
jgi:hypothetical protein